MPDTHENSLGLAPRVRDREKPKHGFAALTVLVLAAAAAATLATPDFDATQLAGRLATFFQHAIESLGGRRSVAIALAVAASIVAAVHALHLLIALRRRTDRAGGFAGELDDSDRRLADLGERLTGAHGVESVIRVTGLFLTEVLDTSEIYVFLEKKDGRFWLQSQNPSMRRELQLPTAARNALGRGQSITRGGWHAWRPTAAPPSQDLDIELLLPLRAASLFGVLALGPRRTERPYDFKDVRFLRHACSQVALGLTKGRLLDRMEEDAEISAALIRAQNEIAFSLNAPDILERLCQITATALDLECSHTLLRDGEEGPFVVAAAHGDGAVHAELVPAIRLSPEMLGNLPERLRSEDAIVSRGGRTGHSILADVLGYGHSSMVIMPLRRDGDLIGLHLAGSRERAVLLTSRHERIARGIAHASSMAFANAHLMQELASASRVKSDFVASMSHELRTPLNHIIGYNDLMLDGAFGPISEEQRDTLERIRRSSHNLLDLIEATLNLSRLDANKEVVDIRDVHLPSLIAEIGDRLAHSCRKPGVSVEWKIHSEVNSMPTDALKLQMILKNLVENGVKFTSRGRVVIEVRRRGQGIDFEVSDTGAGIPKDQQTAVFEAFRRVHDPASPGVGLGLHIVRRLTDLLRGTISLESEVGLGSRFCVWLPFASLSAAHMQVAPPDVELAATTLSSTLH